MTAYPWLVFVHIIGVLAFAFGHGTSSVVAFRIRAEREPIRISALLELSQISSAVMYVGLLVLLVGGIAAGVVGQWFGQWWLWAAIVILVLTMGAMYAIASPYYLNVRHALGQRGPRDMVAPQPRPASEVVALLDSRRPEALAAIGVVGLAAIAWLMVFKPA
jgi:hypothetical protein